MLVAVGVGTALVGLLVWGIGSLAPGVKLGRLPGDIVIEQGGGRVYIPITTMLLASALLTGVLWLVSHLKK